MNETSLFWSNVAISFATIVSAVVALFIALDSNKIKYKIEGGIYSTLELPEKTYYNVRIYNKSANRDICISKAGIRKCFAKGGLVFLPGYFTPQLPCKITYGDFCEFLLDADECKNVIERYNKVRSIYFSYYDTLGKQYKHKIKIKNLKKVIKDDEIK